MQFWVLSAKNKHINTYKRMFVSAGIDSVHVFKENASLVKALKGQPTDAVALFFHASETQLLSMQDDANQPLLEIAADYAKTFKNVILNVTTVDLTYADLSKYYAPNLPAVFSFDSPMEKRAFISYLDYLTAHNQISIGDFLGQGVGIFVGEVKESGRIDAAIDELVSFIDRLNILRDLKEKIALVAEELLYNAIFSAPVDSNGAAKYNLADRSKNLVLEENEKVGLTYGCDGQVFALSIRDAFGSLSHERFKKVLDKMADVELLAPDKENSSGGGLGLFYVLRNCDATIVSVVEGQFTDITVVFYVYNRGQSDGQQRLNFSYRS